MKIAITLLVATTLISATAFAQDGGPAANGKIEIVETPATTPAVEKFNTVEPTPSLTKLTTSKYVASGVTTQFQVWNMINTDCSPRTQLPTARVTTKAEHGIIEAATGDSIVNVIATSNVAPCNGKKAKAFIVTYKSAADYVGPDSATVLMLYQDGSAAEYHYNIIVR